MLTGSSAFSMFSFSLLFALFVQLSAAQQFSHILSRSEDVKSEYDYIIVGGGTAGLTLGDRLTEDGKRKPNHISIKLKTYSLFIDTVLVIEYGAYGERQNPLLINSLFDNCR